MSFKLNNQLAGCLAERKIRQSQLARRLRMSPAYVSRLCSGQIEPSLEAALRIAHYFGKPVELIFQLAEAVQKTNFPSVHGNEREPINTPELAKRKAVK
jgi:transcriptional regulator with XRE-family HTH domain